MPRWTLAIWMLAIAATGVSGWVGFEAQSTTTVSKLAQLAFVVAIGAFLLLLIRLLTGLFHASLRNDVDHSGRR